MRQFFDRSFYTVFLFASLFIFYSLSIDFTISKKYILHEVQSVINDFGFQVENLNYTEENYLDLIDDELLILRFESDSLVFWNSNQFPTIQIDDYSDGKIYLKLLDGGYYLVSRKSNLIGLKKLYDIYPYENEFLINGFTWNKNLLDGVSINFQPNKFGLFNQENSAIGYLDFNKISPTHRQSIILVVLFLLFFTALIAYTYRLIMRLRRKFIVKFMILFVVFILYYFVFGFVNFNSLVLFVDAFQPNSFAFTWFFPSIMHLILFLVLLVSLSLAVHLNKALHNVTNLVDRLKPVFLGLSLLLFYKFLFIVVNNSAFLIGFGELSDLSFTSFLVFFSIALILIQQLILFFVFLPSTTISKVYLVSTGLFFAIIYLFFDSDFLLNAVFILLFFALLLADILGIFKSRNSFVIITTVLLSLSISLNLAQINREKELNKRRVLIQSLALNQDPELEYLFGVFEKSIYQDIHFIDLLAQDWIDGDKINQYLFKHYFSKNKHWNRYDFQTTTCDDSTSLIVKPSNLETSCNSYFYNNLMSMGFITSNQNLYRMEYGSGQINYLGVLRLKLTNSTSKTISIYIEINSKIKRKGFTKLLNPDGMDPFEKLRDYNLARYEKGFLAETYGDYNYESKFIDNMEIGEMKFEVSNEFDHLFYKANSKTCYVISRISPSSLQQFAPFANLLILVLIICFMFILLFNSSFKLWTTPMTFSFRLQLSLILLITVFILIISVLSSYFIQKSNLKKDIRNHFKTAISLQTEFEQKLSKSLSDGKSMESYLYELSLKFSSVFNTDINIYSLEGELLTSTRPQLFDNYLLTTFINPEAFYQLHHKQIPYINLMETIGGLEYFSAYMPFHDGNGRVVAYLNLPQIAQQDQLNREVSSFIMTLMNVYMIMIVLSFLAVLLLSSYIIRPMILIKEKMKRIKIGQTNEHIVWNAKDELGDLVEEYNKMVDQITKSAHLLAKAERESAWQQMAQQVAHEIKNPLTPMKLSLQYMIKTLDEKQPNYVERIRNLSSTLIDQIDTLAEIASAFSDFAKMPIGKMEKINLVEAINSALELYHETENLDLQFMQCDEEIYILGDKNNLIRVFNNLIKNAVQSIDFQAKGLIKITIELIDNQWKIAVSDNGIGISDELKPKIFLPNFTTKSSGMGLGLVVVRNIILQHGGSIEFESEIGIGTTFNIWLNKMANE